MIMSEINVGYVRHEIENKELAISHNNRNLL